MKICKLCDNKSGSKKWDRHHLSYEPEIIILLCHKCHAALHSMAVIPPENRQLMNEWIEQYGNQWVNCNEKYKKSNSYKTLMKSDGHALSKEYQDEWKKQHPEKVKQYNKTQDEKRKRDPIRIQWEKEYQKKYRKEYMKDPAHKRAARDATRRCRAKKQALD
jgi:hypothetical protein